MPRALLLPLLLWEAAAFSPPGAHGALSYPVRSASTQLCMESAGDVNRRRVLASLATTWVISTQPSAAFDLDRWRLLSEAWPQL